MNRPYVIMQVGSSLDGKVAAGVGQETKISSPESFRMLHGLRDACEAIIVGRSTVETDDPSLTVREIPRQRTTQPLRVIFDSALKLKNTHKVFNEGNFLVVHDEKLGDKGEKFIGVASTTDGLSIPDAMSALLERGIKSVLVEGGPTLWTSFLNAGMVDEIYWFQSPVILGGKGVAALKDLNKEAQAWMAADAHVSESFQIDRDTLTILRIQKAS